MPAIAAAFPGTVQDGAVDRARLRQEVVFDSAALRRLEAILHPMVRQDERAFLARARRAGRRAAVLDIPLLLETGGETRVDEVVVVSAPRAVQMARVRQRRRMTDAQIRAIIARQMPDRQKRRRADLVVHTGLSKWHALRQLRRYVKRLFSLPLSGGGPGRGSAAQRRCGAANPRRRSAPDPLPPTPLRGAGPSLPLKGGG